jgi:hypothetical protein
VTLTLPVNILEQLAAIDPDPSRAIVRLASGRAKARATNEPGPPAKLAVHNGRAVITIQPSPALEQRTGVHLVPLPDGRSLISFDEPQTVAHLELLLVDALDDPSLPARERAVFEGIAGILRDARRSGDVSLMHRNIIVLETRSNGRTAAVRRRARRIAAPR